MASSNLCKLLGNGSKRLRAGVSSNPVRHFESKTPACLQKAVPEELVDEDVAPAPQPQRMSNSEAFVETMVAHGVKDIFGIVGSAYMDALDLFPAAGIRFLSVQHEQNAVHMADGYSRINGKHGVVIAQNGPGISNFVTGVAAAYWAHSPVVAITPEAGSMTKGHGGFQEMDQLPVFETITKYQAHVNNPARMAELTARAFDRAIIERGPTQLNIPRDFFYGENNFTIPAPKIIEQGAGGPAALASAAELIASAKNPVLLCGGGVVIGDAIQEARALAEFVSMPVCVTYLHNDAFPADHPLMCGPLGYQGHQGAMNVIAEADVVIALGTRLNPFGTNPQFGIDYWPKNAKLIQVEADFKRLNVTKNADVCIHGDAKKAAAEILKLLRGKGFLASEANKELRMANMKAKQVESEAILDAMTYGDTPVPEGMIKPRQALREMEKVMPKDAMVATDIGNVCSVSNSYLRFNQPGMLAAMTFGNCGYSFPAAMGAKVAAPDRPAIAYAGDGAWGMSLNEVLTCVREKIPTTAVVFHNKQWGAEKKNQVLWFGDRYVGSNLDNTFSYAEIARAMSAEGITCTHADQVGDALKQAIQNQSEGKTTVLELMLTKELGDPFRRDAMKLPQRVLAKYTHTSEVSESSTGQPTDLKAC